MHFTDSLFFIKREEIAISCYIAVRKVEKRKTVGKNKNKNTNNCIKYLN